MVDYNPNIPQGVDNLSTSQGQILNNFSQLESIFAADHYTWDYPTTAFRGQHLKVNFPNTTTVSLPTGSASVIYSKNVSTIASAYFDNASGSTALWRGGSGNGLATFNMNNGFGTGSFTFPNGVIMQWGYASTVSDGQTIPFTTPFPNNCGHVQICGERNTSAERSLWVQSFNQSGVVIRTSSSVLGVLWFAIGN